MNVKPGDFAKIIPPHTRAGVFVSVIEPCTESDFAMLCATEPEWAEVQNVWACSLLIGSPGVDCDLGRAYLLPGDEVWVADAYLRRIDPKADDTIEETAKEASHV